MRRRHVTAAPPGLRRHGRRPSPNWWAIPTASTRRAWPLGWRWRGTREQVAASGRSQPARWCSPAGPPSPSPPRCGGLGAVSGTRAWSTGDGRTHQVVTAVEHSAVRLRPNGPAPSRWCRSTVGGRVDPDAGARCDRAAHRGGARAVGQPRGGHRAACGRGGGRVPRSEACWCTSTRAGCRPGAHRVRRPGRRPAVGERPQARRTGRHRRRAARPPRASHPPSCWAATRNRRAGPAWSRWPPWWASAPPATALAAPPSRPPAHHPGSGGSAAPERRFPPSSEVGVGVRAWEVGEGAAAPDRIRARRGRPRRGHGLRPAPAPAPPPRVPGHRRHRAAGGAPGAGPRRGGRPLGQRLLHRVARALARAAGHGRGRPSVRSGSRWAGPPPMPTWTCCCTRFL